MGRMKSRMQASLAAKNKNKEAPTKKMSKLNTERRTSKDSTASKISSDEMEHSSERGQLNQPQKNDDGKSDQTSKSPSETEIYNETNSVNPSMECRRSSRKKTIKFDVRDLLNKNRKSHKIQIEARIDSNAPKSGAGQATKEELDNKQKNFIEKSAIFRRYSISENKTPPRPPPPAALIQSIQKCVGELEQLPLDGQIDLSTISPLARRLSRTQEILTATMLKPKQVNSLIVTKLENVDSTKELSTRGRKERQQTSPEVNVSSIPKRRRGRPPKSRTSPLLESSDLPNSDQKSDILDNKLEEESTKADKKLQGSTINISNTTKTIDLKSHLDSGRSSSTQSREFDDCLLVLTDDMVVAAEEEVSTEPLVCNEILGSDERSKNISFNRCNSSETSSSETSERQKKIRVSVRRVSINAGTTYTSPRRKETPSTAGTKDVVLRSAKDKTATGQSESLPEKIKTKIEVVYDQKDPTNKGNEVEEDNNQTPKVAIEELQLQSVPRADKQTPIHDESQQHKQKVENIVRMKKVEPGQQCTKEVAPVKGAISQTVMHTTRQKLTKTRRVTNQSSNVQRNANTEQAKEEQSQEIVSIEPSRIEGKVREGSAEIVPNLSGNSEPVLRAEHDNTQDRLSNVREQSDVNLDNYNVEKTIFIKSGNEDQKPRSTQSCTIEEIMSPSPIKDNQDESLSSTSVNPVADRQETERENKLAPTHEIETTDQGRQVQSEDLFPPSPSDRKKQTINPIKVSQETEGKEVGSPSIFPNQKIKSKVQTKSSNAAMSKQDQAIDSQQKNRSQIQEDQKSVSTTQQSSDRNSDHKRETKEENHATQLQVETEKKTNIKVLPPEELKVTLALTSQVAISEDQKLKQKHQVTKSGEISTRRAFQLEIIPEQKTRSKNQTKESRELLAEPPSRLEAKSKVHIKYQNREVQETATEPERSVELHTRKSHREDSREMHDAVSGAIKIGLERTFRNRRQTPMPTATIVSNRETDKIEDKKKPIIANIVAAANVGDWSQELQSASKSATKVKLDLKQGNKTKAPEELQENLSSGCDVKETERKTIPEPGKQSSPVSEYIDPKLGKADDVNEQLGSREMESTDETISKLLPSSRVVGKSAQKPDNVLPEITDALSLNENPDRISEKASPDTSSKLDQKRGTDHESKSAQLIRENSTRVTDTSDYQIGYENHRDAAPGIVEDTPPNHEIGNTNQNREKKNEEVSREVIRSTPNTFKIDDRYQKQENASKTTDSFPLTHRKHATKNQSGTENLQSITETPKSDRKKVNKKILPPNRDNSTQKPDNKNESIASQDLMGESPPHPEVEKCNKNAGQRALDRKDLLLPIVRARENKTTDKVAQDETIVRNKVLSDLAKRLPQSSEIESSDRKRDITLPEKMKDLQSRRETEDCGLKRDTGIQECDEVETDDKGEHNKQTKAMQGVSESLTANLPIENIDRKRVSRSQTKAAQETSNTSENANLQQKAADSELNPQVTNSEHDSKYQSQDSQNTKVNRPTDDDASAPHKPEKKNSNKSSLQSKTRSSFVKKIEKSASKSHDLQSTETSVNESPKKQKPVKNNSTELSNSSDLKEEKQSVTSDSKDVDSSSLISRKPSHMKLKSAGGTQTEKLKSDQDTSHSPVLNEKQEVTPVPKKSTAKQTIVKESRKVDSELSATKTSTKTDGRTSQRVKVSETKTTTIFDATPLNSEDMLEVQDSSQPTTGRDKRKPEKSAPDRHPSKRIYTTKASLKINKIISPNRKRTSTQILTEKVREQSSVKTLKSKKSTKSSKLMRTKKSAHKNKTDKKDKEEETSSECSETSSSSSSSVSSSSSLLTSSSSSSTSSSRTSSSTSSSSAGTSTASSSSSSSSLFTSTTSSSSSDEVKHSRKPDLSPPQKAAESKSRQKSSISGQKSTSKMKKSVQGKPEIATKGSELEKVSKPQDSKVQGDGGIVSKARNKKDTAATSGQAPKDQHSEQDFPSTSRKSIQRTKYSEKLISDKTLADPQLISQESTGDTSAGRKSPMLKKSKERENQGDIPTDLNIIKCSSQCEIKFNAQRPKEENLIDGAKSKSKKLSQLPSNEATYLKDSRISRTRRKTVATEVGSNSPLKSTSEEQSTPNRWLSVCDADIKRSTTTLSLDRDHKHIHLNFDPKKNESRNRHEGSQTAKDIQQDLAGTQDSGKSSIGPAFKRLLRLRKNTASESKSGDLIKPDGLPAAKTVSSTTDSRPCESIKSETITDTKSSKISEKSMGDSSRESTKTLENSGEEAQKSSNKLTKSRKQTSSGKPVDYLNNDNKANKSSSLPQSLSKSEIKVSSQTSSKTLLQEDQTTGKLVAKTTRTQEQDDLDPTQAQKTSQTCEKDTSLDSGVSNPTSTANKKSESKVRDLSSRRKKKPASNNDPPNTSENLQNNPQQEEKCLNKSQEESGYGSTSTRSNTPYDLNDATSNDSFKSVGKSTTRRQLESSFAEALEKSAFVKSSSAKKTAKKKAKEEEKLVENSADEKSMSKKTDEGREEQKQNKPTKPNRKSKDQTKDEETKTKRKGSKKSLDTTLSDSKSQASSLSKLSIDTMQRPIESPSINISRPIKNKGEAKYFPEMSLNLIPAEPTSEAPEPDEPPDTFDPLKDIEKFIEDGVNLLKRGYKLSDDEEDNQAKGDIDLQRIDESFSAKRRRFEDVNEDKKMISASSEEKKESPVLNENKKDSPTESDDKKDLSAEDDNSNSEFSSLATTPTSDADSSNGIRRSHRIKNNSKASKCLVGRGLVRDKERFSMKDDEKAIYSIDDQKLDLAEVEAKNSKFLKNMEDNLNNFRMIRENEYKCERMVSKEAKRMLCDCFLTSEEEERGELGCGEDCLNRLLMIECGADCTVRDRCTNRRFVKFLYSPCRVFRTEKKGFGIMADIEILPGEFIMEYVGEVINGEEFERRRNIYSQEKNRHYYFMALRSDAIIDATAKGNISRFINHSCDPNAETQKWTVNGELRIGFFSRKNIMPGEEITFDYQYQRYGKEAQKCYCESSNCRGWIGEEPSSEDEELDEYEEESEESEEEDQDKELRDEQIPSKPAVPIIPETPVAPKVSLDIVTTESKDEKLAEKEGTPTLPPQPPTVPEAEELQPKKKRTKKRLQERKQDKIKRRDPKQFLEDPDLEDGLRFLVKCGIRNRSDTLLLSRLMVRAKLVRTRLIFLDILGKGELPCRRLFLDYHGLRLLHGWMSDVTDIQDVESNTELRMALLRVLECLPIPNKTILNDSKVYHKVQDWLNNKESMSPDNQSPTNSVVPAESAVESTQIPENVESELVKLAGKLINTWNNLPEVFRIPKRERIEQMKEHEREADRQYKALGEDNSRTDRDYNRERFIKNSGSNNSRNKWPRTERDKDRERRRFTQSGSSAKDGNEKSSTGSAAESLLSKEQRRELFAAKVARDEAEKRLAEERREFEIKCRFFGLDAKNMTPETLPFCVNPATGQWYSMERKPIATPPSYAHVQVPDKPKSTNPNDYRLPEMDLPPLWKFAISPKGQIYYYHVKIRIPQWEPPIKILPLAGQTSTAVRNSESDSSNAENADSSDDDLEIIKGLDQVKLQAYIEKKIEDRRQQRYTRLVEQKSISPRKEEDRIYNQLEVKKYKENKEKIRKRKEEIRKRRDTLNKDGSNESVPTEAGEAGESSGVAALPIQDYLLSSDEEEIKEIKAECNNSPLINKIVQGDKIVDELDALQSKRPLKRSLPIRDKYEHKKRKTEKNKESHNSTKRSKDGDSRYRKIREKFRGEIGGIIIQHLKPYRKETCFSGRITSDEDFNHLARKLTHFVMVKELKYCESIGQTLVVTKSVKNKSREFIKKYMAKYDGVYVRPKNDPEFKEIPIL